jgi:hypothetical protein
MLTLEWADLDVVSADITRLQSQRQAAKMMGNAERTAVLGNELARAITHRDDLISRIAERIGGGESINPPRGRELRSPLVQ